MKIVGFVGPEGQLGAQLCFQEARKLREKEFEGAKNNTREKQSSKKRRRERQGAPAELGSHESLALSSDYELPKSRRESRKTSQRAPEELLESRNGARRGPEELPRGAEELRNRS